jgi:Transcription elongation factor, GreA/GreB, C-term
MPNTPTASAACARSTGACASCAPGSRAWSWALSRRATGARITLETEDGERRCYWIVGPDELDMGSDYISMDAPLGKSLLGRRLDDEVALELAAGTQRYTIVGVDYSEIG